MTLLQSFRVHAALRVAGFSLPVCPVGAPLPRVAASHRLHSSDPSGPATAGEDVGKGSVLTLDTPNVLASDPARRRRG